MKSNTILGFLVITMLFIGIIYIFVFPTQSYSFNMMYGNANKVKLIKSLNSTEAPEVSFVNLNITTKMGSIDVNFTDDSNMIYKIIFTRDEGTQPPLIENLTQANQLFLNITIESGNVTAIFGNNCTYRGNMEVGLGAISATLSNNSKIDFFDLYIAYAGGLSLTILNNASFNRINSQINTGGLLLNIYATNIQSNSTISSRVELGGVIVGSLVDEPEYGMKISALSDIGGILPNYGNFTIMKETKVGETVMELEMITNNYDVVNTKLDIEIFTGAGGSLINQPFFTNFPKIFG